MVYRTMQGKEIDLEKLMKENELMPAIGNLKVNARGDELGPGGKIVRRREEIMQEYYDTNPNAMPKATKSSEPEAEKDSVSQQPKSKNKKSEI